MFSKSISCPLAGSLRRLWTGQARTLALSARLSPCRTSPLLRCSASSTKYKCPSSVGYATGSESSTIPRNENFKKLTTSDVEAFRRLLDSDAAIIDGVSENAVTDIEPFNTDWMRKYQGSSRLVIRPGTTHEVSKVLAYCNEHALAVVPQGGNSGLVGGSVPVHDEIVISMSRMNRIREFDEVSGVLVVDAGCVLENLDNYLAAANHIFPLDLGAKGSCQIGGNVATNAGGLRLLRYGSLHGNVLGIEAVLPDGTVLDDLCKLRKNNTGYDLKQLFIGGEGTIGIITGISVLCPRRPRAVNVALFGLQTYEAAQRAFVAAKTHLSEILSAFELMDRESQRLVASVKNKSLPLPGDFPFYCLVETSGSNGEHDQAKLESYFEEVMEHGIVEDGILAQDETQKQALWFWRESIPECLGHWGGVYKYDVSIPLPELYKLVNDTRSRLHKLNMIGPDKEYPVVDVVGYGHMGDSNLHLNVATRRYDQEIERQLEPFVFEWIAQHSGSISAEHGLGLAKKPFLGYSRDQTMLRLMKDVKQLYDPKGIMNPYKYI